MPAVVCLNAGSSSIKFALFSQRGGAEPTRDLSGKVERIGITPRLVVRSAAGDAVLEHEWSGGAALTHEDLLEQVFEIARTHGCLGDIAAVGHRVVHGGVAHAAPVRIDDALMVELERLSPLAPLHQPHNLSAIRAVSRQMPGVPQVACFDTAFHRTMPDTASRLPLPRRFHDQGIRRYGFHGLSYEWIARRLREVDPAAAAGRVIAAHLGNGASLCAMRDGRSVDTTMGLSTLDGLMMGTRCGALDPGVVLHLQDQIGMSAAEVERMLYHDCGLLGVSGLSSDMRELLASRAVPAREAVDLFCWRAAREAGALAASLGGLDAFVFTGGIGENSAEIRANIGGRLAFLGIALDVDANAAGEVLVHSPASAAKVFVLPTDEERMIALHTLSFVRGAS